MKKGTLFLTIVGILAVSGIVMMSLWTTNRSNNEDRFSVIGSGSVYAKADIANIQVGFRSGVKKTAAEATTDATTKMNEIIKALKKLGIEDKDIKTSDYNLNPSYKWTEARGQELVGYEVYQNLTLKVRDLDKIGDVIARTTEQGANQVGNVSFTIDDEYELKNQAREMAIEKAKEKAELIAKQSGMKLGKIKSVYENTVSNPELIRYSNAKMTLDVADQAAGGLATPTIQSGQNEVKVEVTLVYEVK